MLTTVALDIGETLVRDDRYWAAWADWFDVPRHTPSALVGTIVAQGRDNADAVRLLRPGVDLAAEYEAREAAGQGERLEESNLYSDVRPALAEMRDAVSEAASWRLASQYLRIAQALPELLAELSRALHSAPTEHEQAEVAGPARVRVPLRRRRLQVRRPGPVRPPGRADAVGRRHLRGHLARRCRGLRAR